MNATLHIHTLGRPTRVVPIMALNRAAFGRTGAAYVRAYARDYGISAWAVDYDVVSL